MLMMRGWGANLGQVRRIGSSCFTFLGSIPTDAHDAGRLRIPPMWVRYSGVVAADADDAWLCSLISVVFLG